MKERILTCIVCPRGCTLTVSLADDGKEIKDISGFACKRGKEYAETECTHPKRTVTSTVMCEDGSVIAVKTSAPVPKEKVFEVMDKINSARARVGTRIGDSVISDVLGLGVDVIATSNHGV